MNRIDPEQYVGKTYGNMTVISFIGRRKRGTHNDPYLCCKCKCGRTFELIAFAIKRISSGERPGRCKKCAIKSARSKNRKHGAAKRVGKQSVKLPVLKAWSSMMRKCIRAGLSVEQRWTDFNVFYKEMRRPSESHKLWFRDRKLGMVDGNIFWKPPAIDINWRSIEFRGDKMSLVEWALHFGIKPDTMRARLVKEFNSIRDEGKNPLEHMDLILDTAFTCSTDRGNVAYEADMSRRLKSIAPPSGPVSEFEPRVHKIR